MAVKPSYAYFGDLCGREYPSSSDLRRFALGVVSGNAEHYPGGRTYEELQAELTPPEADVCSECLRERPIAELLAKLEEKRPRPRDPGAPLTRARVVIDPDRARHPRDAQATPRPPQ